ncbi:MAG: hypothetical protein JNL95_03740 [Chitinophagales bacterium]|nr:hypothetical protein [Chitinophagales bacterium]
MHDTEFEKGYNMAYYLEQYAPDILKRAMKGLNGEPKEFFQGLELGQKDGRKAIREQDKKQQAEKDKQDLERQRIDRDREATYKDKLQKMEENQKIEAHIHREFDENPFEQVLLKARREQKQEREDSERRERLKKQTRAKYSEMRIDAAKLKERQDADKKYLDEIKQKFEVKPKNENNAEKTITEKVVAQNKTTGKSTESQTKISDKIETRMQEIADIRNTTESREQEKSEGRDTTKNR